MGDKGAARTGARFSQGTSGPEPLAGSQEPERPDQSGAQIRAGSASAGLRYASAAPADHPLFVAEDGTWFLPSVQGAGQIKLGDRPGRLLGLEAPKQAAPWAIASWERELWRFNVFTREVESLMALAEPDGIIASMPVLMTDGEPGPEGRQFFAVAAVRRPDGLVFVHGASWGTGRHPRLAPRRKNVEVPGRWRALCLIPSVSGGDTMVFGVDDRALPKLYQLRLTRASLSLVAVECVGRTVDLSRVACFHSIAVSPHPEHPRAAIICGLVGGEELLLEISHDGMWECRRLAVEAFRLSATTPRWARPMVYVPCPGGRGLPVLVGATPQSIVELKTHQDHPLKMRLNADLGLAVANSWAVAAVEGSGGGLCFCSQVGSWAPTHMGHRAASRVVSLPATTSQGTSYFLVAREGGEGITMEELKWR